MSPDNSVELEDIWKRFRSDDESGLAKAEMARWRARRRGDVSTGWRWVLRGIDLEIRTGETVALLGVNGSGKSTLLKIVASMMMPSVGHVRSQGRISSLIDVRGGLHPELSGRENIYLYSKMLGLPRSHIARRFDEIVEFAGISGALDRQVKHYSAGMALRLGFTIVTHADPQILIIDEALAVGDALFRRKCLDHIGGLVSDGATLVYVSHDLETVEATCSRSIWLDSGEVRRDGATAQVIAEYRDNLVDTLMSHTGPYRVIDTSIRPESDADVLRTGEPVEVTATVQSPDAVADCAVVVGLCTGEGEPILVARSRLDVVEGDTLVRCRFGAVPLAAGHYHVWMAIVDDEDRALLTWQPIGRVEVHGPAAAPLPLGVAQAAPILVPTETIVGRGQR